MLFRTTEGDNWAPEIVCLDGVNGKKKQRNRRNRGGFHASSEARGFAAGIGISAGQMCLYYRQKAAGVSEGMRFWFLPGAEQKF